MPSGNNAQPHACLQGNRLVAAGSVHAHATIEGVARAVSYGGVASLPARSTVANCYGSNRARTTPHGLERRWSYAVTVTACSACLLVLACGSDYLQFECNGGFDLPTCLLARHRHACLGVVEQLVSKRLQWLLAHNQCNPYQLCKCATKQGLNRYRRPPDRATAPI